MCVVRPFICRKSEETHKIDLITTCLFQERLDQICEESRLISERVEELRTAGGQIRGQGADLHQIQQITQQLELLQSKQQQLLQERDEHQRCIR